MTSIENGNNYEQETNVLDRSIDDFDKNQERIDFTERMKKLEDIYNKFKSLDKDISSIVDENKKKELRKRLDNLGLKMLDLISDGSIDNVIDGKTKDEFINNEVKKVNDLLFSRLETIINGNSLEFGRVNEILSQPLTPKTLEGMLGYLGFPYGYIRGSGEEGGECLGFKSPLNGETYALVSGQLRVCEPIFDVKELKSIYGTGDISYPKGFSVKGSEKPRSGGIDNPTLMKQTWKLAQDLGHGFGSSLGVSSTGLSGTPELSFWKSMKVKIGKNVGLKPKVTASYSPGSIGKSMNLKENEEYVGGWKSNNVYKLKAEVGISFWKFLLNITETYKAKNFHSFEKKGLSTDIVASWSLNPKTLLSAIVTKGKSEFFGFSIKKMF